MDSGIGQDARRILWSRQIILLSFISKEVWVEIQVSFLFIFDQKIFVMVIFNELRISDDKQCLTIDCAIEGLDIYSDMHIKTIDLEYYKNVETMGVPSSKALNVYTYSPARGVSDPQTAIKINVNAAQLSTIEDFGTEDFDKGLFYVIVECDGTLPAAAALLSCGMDSTVDIGVALDWKRVYEIGMRFISSLTSKCLNECSDKSSNMNFILLWNALRFALISCDYVQVAYLWDIFLRIYNNNSTQFSAACGCGQ